MPLTATVETSSGQADPHAFQVVLRVRSDGSGKVVIVNPDMGVPSAAVKWPLSNEAYQTSMLMSFGYLSITVSDAQGHTVPQQPHPTWATPVLKAPLELGPGDSFAVTVPLGTFYHLESGKRYELTLQYGDQSQKVSAHSSVHVP